MGTILLVLIVCGILYLIHYLKKINYKLDEVVEIDNPYLTKSMPLDKYEKDLDTMLNKYTKEDKKITLNEEVFEENMNLPDVNSIEDGKKEVEESSNIDKFENI